MRITLVKGEHFYLGPYKVGFRLVLSKPNCNEQQYQQQQQWKTRKNQYHIELIIHNPCYSQTNNLPLVNSTNSAGTVVNNTTSNGMIINAAAPIMISPGMMMVEPVKILPLSPFNTFNGYFIQLMNTSPLFENWDTSKESCIELEILMPEECYNNQVQVSGTNGLSLPQPPQQQSSSSSNMNLSSSSSSSSSSVSTSSVRLPTLAELLMSTQQHNTLLNFMTKLNLFPILNQLNGFFTLMAPTDMAFAKLNLQIPGIFNSLSNSDLTKLLQYHIINRKLEKTDIQNNTFISTLNRDLLDFRIDPIGGPGMIPIILVHNVPLSYQTPTNYFDKGIVYPIDQVLIPNSFKSLIQGLTTGTTTITTTNNMNNLNSTTTVTAAMTNQINNTNNTSNNIGNVVISPLSSSSSSSYTPQQMNNQNYIGNGLYSYSSSSNQQYPQQYQQQANYQQQTIYQQQQQPSYQQQQQQRSMYQKPRYNYENDDSESDSSDCSTSEDEDYNRNNRYSR